MTPKEKANEYRIDGFDFDFCLNIALEEQKNQLKEKIWKIIHDSNDSLSCIYDIKGEINEWGK